MQPSSLTRILGTLCVASLCSDSASCHALPVAVDDTGDGRVPETARLAPAINAVLQVSALVALLWLVLVRAVPPLSLFSPWLFNGMVLTTARNSQADYLMSIPHWARTVAVDIAELVLREGLALYPQQ